MLALVRNFLVRPLASSIHKCRSNVMTTVMNYSLMEIVSDNVVGEDGAVKKHEYDSTKIFLDKAKQHFSSGDLAQCCEKLFGSVKFALRSYVKELGELHSMPTIASNKWNYSKYRKLCMIISKNSDESTAFNDWRAAEHLHVHGWNLNELEYDAVELGFKDVEEFVQQIANWPKSKELATRISMEVFEFDETFIAGKISKLIEARNYEWALQSFGIKMEYSKKQRELIVKTYNDIYKRDLRKDLIAQI